MPDKDRAWTRPDSALKGLDATAIPPVRARVLAPSVKLIIDVYGYRQPALAAEAEHPQGVQVIVHDSQLELAIDPHPVDLDSRL